MVGKKASETAGIVAALEAANCGVLWIDASSGKIVDANARFLRHLGFGDSDLLTRKYFEVFSETSAIEIKECIDRLKAGEADAVYLEATLLRPDQTICFVKGGLSLQDKALPLVSMVVIDVTTEVEAKRSATLASENLQAAIEALPHGFVLYDKKDRLVLCNERYKQLYPKSASAMVIGAKFQDILEFGLAAGEYADAVGNEKLWLEQRLAKHKKPNEPIQQKLSDGKTLQIIERKTPNGGRVGLRIDVSELVGSRERAVRAEQRLRDAIEALPAGFWLFNANDELVLINENYRQMYKKSAPALREGRTYEEILRYGLERNQYPEAHGREEAWLAEVLESRSTNQYELEYQVEDGKWVRSVNHPTSEGGMVGFRVDITELKKRQIELEHAARTDPLTELLNRRGLSEKLRLNKELNLKGKAFACLHIDLDKFKSVNDLYGHDAGDVLLQKVAALLEDAAGPDDIIARIGGDEFLVCRFGKQNAQELIAFTEQLQKRLVEPVRLNGRICHIGACIGVAVCETGNTDSVDQALVDADIALNYSKSTGRNQSTLFSPWMRAESLEYAEVAEEVQRGLENSEFVAHFQPTFCAETLQVGGFESLIRWNHPQLGLLSPNAFLPACDRAGLTPALDRVVLREATDFLNRLESQGLTELSVSVNVSATQLKDPDTVSQYIWMLEAKGLRPERLRIEILESTLLEERSSNIIENIKAFSAKGFPIDLDDFGTGHTAIISLRKYPVDRIKIDRSLISGIDTDGSLRIIVDALISLGRGLNLKVLTEGIERQSEHELVRVLGATCVQGFLFAQPMTAEDCVAWLSRKPDSVRRL